MIVDNKRVVPLLLPPLKDDRTPLSGGDYRP